MQTTDPEHDDKRPDGIWRRGLVSLVLIILFGIAEAVVIVVAVLQFGWMLIAGRRNPRMAAFGDRLGHWLAVTARFQAGHSEDKPFPWTEW